jgi:hypothetical protein
VAIKQNNVIFSSKKIKVHLKSYILKFYKIMENSTKEMVPPSRCVIITRYNEYIDWIRYIIDSVDFIYIYNKGQNMELFSYFDIQKYLKKIKIIQLPNIGRIDHTLAYHILEHWDNLPDILINLPGSIMMCKKKGYYLSSIMRRLDTMSRYRGFYSPRFHKVSRNFNYSISGYHAEGLCNRNNNPFIKSEYPDFQAWKLGLIDDRPMKYIAMRGMFTVSKENITHIDKRVYTNLLESLSVGDNIENGHFAERIWAHLFRQYSFDTKTPVTKSDELTKTGEQVTKTGEITVSPQSGTPQTV